MLVLNFKLTLDEIEREVFTSKTLDAGERIMWKRWIESQNTKCGRRSRLRAPCCGKSTYRFRLVPDDNGYFYCQLCWDYYSQAQWQANEHAQQVPSKKVNEKQQESPPATEKPAIPPWREHPLAKKKKRDLTTGEMDAPLLGLAAVVTSA